MTINTYRNRNGEYVPAQLLTPLEIMALSAAERIQALHDRGVCFEVLPDGRTCLRAVA